MANLEERNGTQDKTKKTPAKAMKPAKQAAVLKTA